MGLGLGAALGLGCGQGAATSGDVTTGSTAAASSSSTDDTGGDSGDGTGPDGGCAPIDPVPDGVVLTASGPIAGVATDGVVAYLGVPFAAPPTGALRWQPPVDPACWSEVRSADAPGPVCAQLEAEGGAVVGDEDCLSLNLWAPQAEPIAPRPVMVYIHGGGHAVGSGSDPLFDGTRLAASHDVVVVTFNYRLGALGYLAHGALDASDVRGVSGNYGLLDQIHALRWVAANATAFGGDPDNVTLFGESAGAVGTCAVLGAPAAEGLVHRAIVQSGTCSQRPSSTYRADVGEPWVAASPCAAQADVAACLRALPPEAVIAAEPTGFPSVSALGQFWSAHVDGATLPASTLDQLRTGDALDVPLVIGANAEETARDVPPLDEAAYEALVLATFGPTLGPVVLAAYPVADHPSPTAAYVALSGDVKFVCGARRAAEAARAGGGAPVFRYHFAYDGYTVAAGADASAFHGLELIYVFGNFAALSPGAPYQPNADDEALAAMLGAAWTSFARSGDPSTMALAWPSYATGDDPYVGLDVPATSGDGVRTAQCDFWDGLGGG